MHGQRPIANLVVDHLTNFGLLIDPWFDTASSHAARPPEQWTGKLS